MIDNKAGERTGGERTGGKTTEGDSYLMDVI